MRILAVALSLSVFTLGCTSKEDIIDKVEISLNSTELMSDEGSVFVTISANGVWNLSLDFGDNQDNWASINKSSGKSNDDLILTYKENNDQKDRIFKIIAHCGNAISSLEITQKGKAVIDKDEEVGKQNRPQWLELPKTDNPKYHFFYTIMPIRNIYARNYSFYYDNDSYTSLWVAYPLYREAMKKRVKRTNQFKDNYYDSSKIPISKQQDLSRGYRSNYSNGWRFDRGHQIPSADRLCSFEANLQTFHSVNMTPQNHDFNSGLWGVLENSVRSWASLSDTVYVVTGCILKGSNQYAFDASGKKIPIPTAYYKAILRYAKNSNLGFDNYAAIGFYFDHKPYLGDSLSKNMSMSISELEQKVGTEFFVNLKNKVGQSVVVKIKNQNPRDIKWWWNNK